MTKRIHPHGEILVNLLINRDEIYRVKNQATHIKSLDVNSTQLSDVEMLINGAFSPLTGFFTKKEHESVVNNLRLPNGILWPIPINLDVTEETANSINSGESIALRDAEGVLIAILEVNDIWRPDKLHDVKKIYGTTDKDHPGVNFYLNSLGPIFIGGKLTGVEPPKHYDFNMLRLNPTEIRGRFDKLGWDKISAFQTSDLIHRAERELAYQASQQNETNLLLHPTIGTNDRETFNSFCRIRCYQHVIRQFPAPTTMLNLLPITHRWAGTREIILNAIVNQNFGCTHFIYRNDIRNEYTHLDPLNGDAIETRFGADLAIKFVPSEIPTYSRRLSKYIPASKLETHDDPQEISLSDLRRRLDDDLEIPNWFSYPDVIDELRKQYPPKYKQGFTVFLTGLSGAGKSTIANALKIKLLERGDRRVTLLDGDAARKLLSSELGFSREHRDLNIQRIGFVASEITKNGGIAICAPIAPYSTTRNKVREMIDVVGGFIEVYVATPIEVCEKRDRKGLYKKARAGLIKEFTGVSDPYETPINAELTIDTSRCTPEEAAQRIVLKIENLGYIR